MSKVSVVLALSKTLPLFKSIRNANFSFAPIQEHADASASGAIYDTTILSLIECLVPAMNYEFSSMFAINKRRRRRRIVLFLEGYEQLCTLK